ncbi:uncharacterized protein LOC143228624 isoform X1 [Tachypleus tridentatus]|uniref:uncharacterized protein LOC143228624 isoform X1 n=3 Tax=Tachypleus tridentatus TaxID=6853 RepID=UPI003FD13CF5
MRKFTDILFLHMFCQVLLAERLLRNETRINDHMFVHQSGCRISEETTATVFDLEQFLGDWYELFKTKSGFTHLNSGLWRLEMNEAKKVIFTYVAETEDKHCINPVRGEVHLTGNKPGEIVLKYVRFNSRVEEKIQVIYVDELVETAVVYACYQFLSERGHCDHQAMYSAIWSRKKSSQLPRDLSVVTTRMCIDRRLMNPQRPHNCQLYRYDPDDELDNEQDWKPDLCFLPLRSGFCTDSRMNYYHNPTSGECKTFIYSGCGGNENNFFTLKECQETCVDKTGKFMCSNTAPCALTCPVCCTEKEGCVECECEATKQGMRVPEKVEGEVVPVELVPRAPECKRADECNSSCSLEHIQQDCFICKCSDKGSNPGHKHAPETVNLPHKPEDKIPYDSECQTSPYDCPHNCAVYEFNVGCFKCDCNESSAIEGGRLYGTVTSTYYIVIFTL